MFERPATHRALKIRPTHSRLFSMNASSSFVLRLATALAITAVFGAAASTVSGAAPAASRPNIILILVNDLRGDETGYAGHPSLHTPHLDRLARGGARFTDGFVTTPDTAASFAGLLNGRHPAAGGPRVPAESAFPRILRDSGYHTAFIGQWPLRADQPADVGFEEWVTSEGGYRNPTLRTKSGAQTESGYVTDVLSGHAVRFVQQSHEKPYCLVLAHAALHGSAGAAERMLTAAERHRSLYAGQVPRRRPGPEILKNPRTENAPIPAGPVTTDEEIRNRWRALAAVDEAIGRIIETLEAAGQFDQTLIIFTSDQGCFYGEHGRTGPDGAAYEEAIHVPLLIHYPRVVKRGVVPSQMALNIDLAPTLLDLAQVPVTPAVAPIDGMSLARLLRGEGGSWRASFLIEGVTSAGGTIPRPYQAVRTAHWKYIRFPGTDGGEELYDHHADHYELTNLAGRPSAKNELRRWSSELAKVLRPPR